MDLDKFSFFLLLFEYVTILIMTILFSLCFVLIMFFFHFLCCIILKENKAVQFQLQINSRCKRVMIL